MEPIDPEIRDCYTLLSAFKKQHNRKFNKRMANVQYTATAEDLKDRNDMCSRRIKMAAKLRNKLNVERMKKAAVKL